MPSHHRFPPWPLDPWPPQLHRKFHHVDGRDLWGEQGSRPPAPRDCRYSRAYIFGAVRPARGTGAALVMPFADKQAMTLHLPEISQAVTPGAHAIVIVDGAGWHKPGRRLTLQRQHPDPASLRTRAEPAREHLAVPSAELPRQPRLRHLRPHRPGMLRRLERPHPTTRAHQNNRVTRMGQGGQRLMPLVSSLTCPNTGLSRSCKRSPRQCQQRPNSVTSTRKRDEGMAEP